MGKRGLLAVDNKGSPLLGSAARSSAANCRVRSCSRVRQSGSVIGSFRKREDPLADPSGGEE